MADYTTRRHVMVDTQIRTSDVTKFPIIDAMLSIPREVFVPAEKREAAYMGENFHLGDGRWMLEPRTLAKLLDALDVKPDEVALDIACGLGYSTAVLARLADFVVGVEDDEARAQEAQTILSEQGVDNAAVVQAPLSEGAPRNGPYDVILIQGAVEELPQALTAQLREGGRIGCLFGEGHLGVARVGYMIDGHLTWRFAFNAGAPVLDAFRKRPAFTL